LSEDRIADFARRASEHPAFRVCAEAFNANAVVIWSFFASRLTLLAVGLLTQTLIRPITTSGNQLDLSRHQAMNIWGAWDTGWYLDIALNGYQRAPGADGQANWAFFPALPGLAAGLAHLTGLTPFEAMLAISNIGFFAALLMAHRLARAEFDQKAADLCVVLLCVAPGSFIFSSAYTEALFLACLAGSLLLLRNRRWLLAGLAAAAAALTRNIGVGLLLPYGLAAMERLVLGFKAGTAEPLRAPEILRIGLGGLAPVAALVGFMSYLQMRTGDALAFVHIQAAWRRSLGAPFAGLLQGLWAPSSVNDADLLSFATAWLAIGLLAALAAMRRWRLLSLALFLTLAPLATGVASFTRYALVILPLWMILAKILADRPRTATACIAVLAMLNGFMMVVWTLALRVAT
jgi:hypothetical protein